MANESELRKQMEATYPVSQWSRTTAADGKWLNKNTIKPLIDRDNFLADQIDGFDAKIQAEAVARAAADTAIEKSFANEATERENTDKNLDARIDNYADDLEAHKRLDASSDELSSDKLGHLKNTAYKKFNDAANAVEDNKDNWDNISTIKVGTDEVTGNTVTITGNKNINVTADASSKKITVSTTGTVGNKTTPIYMKADGTFEACNTTTNSNKFGNAVISLQGKNAYGEVCVNNNSPISITPELNCEPLYNYDKVIYLTTPYPILSTKILNDCIDKGVNNFIVRFDELTIPEAVGGSIQPSENICDLSIDVEKLTQYKMYTLNLVPLSLETANNKYLLSAPAESGRMQFSLTFNADDDHFIDYSDANYKCRTFGYLYNVPAFGVNKRDGYKCTYDTTSCQYVIPEFSNNSDITTECWQLNLNDTSEYDYNRQRVYTYVDLQTMQPHSEISLFTDSEITTCNPSITLDGGTFEQLGSNKISAIMMEFGGEFDTEKETGTTIYNKLVVYRRQLSFMRGQDITVESKNVQETSKYNYTKITSNKMVVKYDPTTKTVSVPYYNTKYNNYNTSVANTLYKTLNGITINSTSPMTVLGGKVRNCIRKALNKTAAQLPDSWFTLGSVAENEISSISYKLSQNGKEYTVSSILDRSNGSDNYYYCVKSDGTLEIKISSEHGQDTKETGLLISNFNKKITDGSYTEDNLSELSTYFKGELKKTIPQIKDMPDSEILCAFRRATPPAGTKSDTVCYDLYWSYTLPEYTGYTLYFFTEATY